MEIFEVNKLRKEYGTLVAVNDVSFSLGKGQVLGLIGPNGAGKTTLLRMLATVLRPTSGSVRILGHDSAKQYLDIRKHLGYLPDFFNLYNDLTLRECLEFFA
ncbi:MAG: ATP-binding cassette domain-containing protein, partial [Planctomycetota bacterium]